MFAGDLLHGAIQIHEPHLNSCFEEDEEGARASRARMFAYAADHRALVFPAHLPGQGAFEIRREERVRAGPVGAVLPRVMRF